MCSCGCTANTTEDSSLKASQNTSLVMHSAYISLAPEQQQFARGPYKQQCLAPPTTIWGCKKEGSSPTAPFPTLTSAPQLRQPLLAWCTSPGRHILCAHPTEHTLCSLCRCGRSAGSRKRFGTQLLRFLLRNLS